MSSAHPPLPPHALVGSFRFATTVDPAPVPLAVPVSASVSAVPPGMDVPRELDAGVGKWEGRAMFVSSRPARAGTSGRVPGTGTGTGTGTSRSPIRVSPSPSPSSSHFSPSAPTIASTSSTSWMAPSVAAPVSAAPDAEPTAMATLTRPRGVPAYSSPRSRTAYTPPRALPPDARPGQSPSSSTSTAASAASYRDSTGGVTNSTSKTRRMHPFFSRSRSAPIPPPVAARPRLVAHYSSTSDSTATQTTLSQGTQATHSSLEAGPVDSAPAPGPGEIAELAELIWAVDISRDRWRGREPLKSRPTVPSKSAAAATSGTKGKTTTKTTKTKTTKPKPSAQTSRSTSRNDCAPKSTTPTIPIALPTFSYQSYPEAGSVPRIAYTASTDEANDLLSCLRGPVLGFDIEWPIRWTRETGKGGVAQGRTALMQFCDERLVVLIHLRGMKDLPQQAVDLLADPRTYKTGVAIRNDALKLVRDFGAQFPSGISGLLDLSHLARRVDPIGTGPGARTISLVHLGRAYLGREIAKDVKVRTGNWSNALTEEAVAYATNDVWSSLYIYKALVSLAEERSIPIDLEHQSLTAGAGIESDRVRPRVAARLVPLSAEDLAQPVEAVAPVGPVGPAPRPAELRALNQFAAGMTAVDIAAQGGIKESTVQSYIFRALSLLPDDALTIDEKRRLLDGVAPDQYVVKMYRKVYRRIQKEVGEPTSDSEEAEETEHDARQSEPVSLSQPPSPSPSP